MIASYSKNKTKSKAENDGISTVKNNDHIKNVISATFQVAFEAGDSRGQDGINFIIVDKSAGAIQSPDRSQFRRHLKCLPLKIIMSGVKKGSNA